MFPLPVLRKPCSAGMERGSVTAEFAAVVPAVFLVLALCLGGFSLVTKQAQLQDAAATAARSAARDDSADIRQLVPGATAHLERRGNLLCARVTGTGHLVAMLGELALTATSCTLAETP